MDLTTPTQAQVIESVTLLIECSKKETTINPRFCPRMVRAVVRVIPELARSRNYPARKSEKQSGRAFVGIGEIGTSFGSQSESGIDPHEQTLYELVFNKGMIGLCSSHFVWPTLNDVCRQS